MDMPSWHSLIRDPPPGRHVVVLYRDEPFLTRAVATWCAEALRLRGGALLIGTVLHVERIRSELTRGGYDVPQLERSGRLVIIDADWLMSQFMLDGGPDRATFRRLVAEIVGTVAQRVDGPVRAWGEMVDMLTARGDPGTAHLLEQMWNESLEENGIALLCSYKAMDAPAEKNILRDAVHTHTHVFPQPQEGGLALIGEIARATRSF